jgi:hypothetical protein
MARVPGAEYMSNIFHIKVYPAFVMDYSWGSGQPSIVYE